MQRFGPFEVEGVLGKGGMGVVYRARDPRLKREVALKVVVTLRDTRLERFKREAEIAASLHHSGIVAVHEFGVSDGNPFLACELVEGALNLTVAWKGVDLARRVGWIRDAARALGHAHQRGIVHRDVKPENLLVGADGRVRVTDFGLALARGQERLTQTGGLAGTPTHMAPEQFDGKVGEVTPATDVWALGIVLYQALTDRLPFEPETLFELYSCIKQGRIPPPSQVNPAVPAALEALCLRCLQVDPAERFPDGEALAQALETLPTASRRGRLLVGALAVCLVGVAGVFVNRSGTDDPPPAPEPAVRKTVPEPKTEPVPKTVPVPKKTRIVRGELPHSRRKRHRVWAAFLDDARALTWGDDGVRVWDLTARPPPGAGPGQGTRLRAGSPRARSGGLPPGRQGHPAVGRPAPGVAPADRPPPRSGRPGPGAGGPSRSAAARRRRGRASRRPGRAPSRRALPAHAPHHPARAGRAGGPVLA